MINLTSYCLLFGQHSSVERQRAEVSLKTRKTVKESEKERELWRALAKGLKLLTNLSSRSLVGQHLASIRWLYQYNHGMAEVKVKVACL